MGDVGLELARAQRLRERAALGDAQLAPLFTHHDRQRVALLRASEGSAMPRAEPWIERLFGQRTDEPRARDPEVLDEDRTVVQGVGRMRQRERDQGAGAQRSVDLGALPRRHVDHRELALQDDERPDARPLQALEPRDELLYGGLRRLTSVAGQQPLPEVEQQATQLLLEHDDEQDDDRLEE